MRKWVILLIGTVMCARHFKECLKNEAIGVCASCLNEVGGGRKSLAAAYTVLHTVTATKMLNSRTGGWQAFRCRTVLGDDLKAHQGLVQIAVDNIVVETIAHFPICTNQAQVEIIRLSCGNNPVSK